MEIFPPLLRCVGKDGEPAVRWTGAQQFHNDLQFYLTHEYRVYNITACVDVRHLLGRTKTLECGVLENLEDRLRNIIESAIAEGCIDLVAAPIFDAAGNREYTRYIFFSQSTATTTSVRLVDGVIQDNSESRVIIGESKSESHLEHFPQHLELCLDSL